MFYYYLSITLQYTIGIKSIIMLNNIATHIVRWQVAQAA